MEIIVCPTATSSGGKGVGEGLAVTEGGEDGVEEGLTVAAGDGGAAAEDGDGVVAFEVGVTTEAGARVAVDLSMTLDACGMMPGVSPHAGRKATKHMVSKAAILRALGCTSSSPSWLMAGGQ